MRRLVVTALLLLATGAAAGQGHLTSSYRDQRHGDIRGLTSGEITGLREGKGMGLARAAELNGYPGPRHVLDAAGEGWMPLTEGQRQAVERLHDEMAREARRLGALVLDEERALEAAFQTRAITRRELDARTARIATLQGELRAVHLRAHLATRALLTDEQLARYDELRGYATGSAGGPDHGH